MTARKKETASGACNTRDGNERNGARSPFNLSHTLLSVKIEDVLERLDDRLDTPGRFQLERTVDRGRLPTIVRVGPRGRRPLGVVEPDRVVWRPEADAWPELVEAVESSVYRCPHCGRRGGDARGPERVCSSRRCGEAETPYRWGLAECLATAVPRLEVDDTPVSISGWRLGTAHLLVPDLGVFGFVDVPERRALVLEGLDDIEETLAVLGFEVERLARDDVETLLEATEVSA